jgi:hypothetical protein
MERRCSAAISVRRLNKSLSPLELRSGPGTRLRHSLTRRYAALAKATKLGTNWALRSTLETSIHLVATGHTDAHEDANDPNRRPES